MLCGQSGLVAFDPLKHIVKCLWSIPDGQHVGIDPTFRLSLAKSRPHVECTFLMDAFESAKAIASQKPDRKIIAPMVRHSNGVPLKAITIKIANTNSVQTPISHATSRAQGVRLKRATAPRI